MTESTAEPVRWTSVSTLSIKGGSPSSPLETPVPHGPAHGRRRVRHVHGPAVRWREAGGFRGTLIEGETLELQDQTIFWTEPLSGTGTLILERAA
jgi:hypothetical protein